MWLISYAIQYEEDDYEYMQDVYVYIITFLTHTTKNISCNLQNYVVLSLQGHCEYIPVHVKK